MRDKRLMAPQGCLWPTSYYTSCGAAPTQGRLCTHHLGQVLAHVGGWECAWPGCQRLSAAGGGICAFHAAIATGKTESKSHDCGSMPMACCPDARSQNR